MTIEERLDKLEARNTRVEADKAWETSLLRRVSILCLTYIVITVTLIIIKNPHPLTNAIIPSIGFILSTLTLSGIKKIWKKSK